MASKTGGLRIAWLEGAEALTALAAEWRALADRVEADTYATPEWVLTWWRHFGTGRKLAALTARHPDGTLAGLLPFMTEMVWAGPLPVRVARLAASDPHVIRLRSAVEPGLLTVMLEHALARLLGAGGVHVVTLTPVSEAGDLVGAMREAMADERRWRLTEASAGNHTLFRLPKTFDAYLAALSKKRRGQFRRDLRKLTEEHGLHSRLFHPDAATFCDFVAFHDQQWRERGRGGHFTDWRGSAAFFAELADALRDRGSVWFDEQAGKDQPLATQFALVDGGVCHWRLPARATGPELEQLSVGKVGLVLMIKRLIDAGVTRIEAGGGDYGYKLLYGGEAVGLRRMIFTRGGKVARLRLALLTGWARVLQLGYYRLWFVRVMPRLRKVLPLGHRPLWKQWIKTRI